MNIHCEEHTKYNKDCKACKNKYRLFKEGEKPEPKPKIDNVADDIHFQVCLKIASEQLRSASIPEIVKFARDLQKEAWGD